MLLALGVRAPRTWRMEASWRPPLARTITLSRPAASSLYGRKVVLSNQMKFILNINTGKTLLTRPTQLMLLNLVTIVVSVHGKLNKLRLMVIGCVVRTAGNN